VSEQDLCRRLKAVEDQVRALNSRVHEATVWKWLTAATTTLCAILLTGFFTMMLNDSRLVQHERAGHQSTELLLRALNEKMDQRDIELNKVIRGLESDLDDMRYTLYEAFPGVGGTRGEGGPEPLDDRNGGP
jgi:uncharacterized protein YlxW (UPF0749 family)